MTSRQDIEAVLEQFRKRRALLEALCTKTKALIEQSLEDAGVRYQSVQARVKSERKLREKYEDRTKNYAELDDITDQAGLRVITYYEEEVDKVAEIIRREFCELPTKSVDKRKTDPDRFGYYALHFVGRHLERRVADVEYRKFGDTCFEIQITPILQHAWAEIEHEWYDLKDAFPGDVKRRFSRISAVLEVVGSEFSEIRKKRDNYTKAVELQVETQVAQVPLDALSLRSILAETWVPAADQEVATLLGVSLARKTSESANTFVLQTVRLLGITTVEKLRGAFDSHHGSLKTFVAEYRTLRSESAQSDALPSGVSLVYLTLMLVASRGEAELSQALAGYKTTLAPGGIAGVIAAAKRLVPQSGA
jgi:ppGpp synthetase/RelA/SpoT-type nucleotidyltranferase